MTSSPSTSIASILADLSAMNAEFTLYRDDASYARSAPWSVNIRVRNDDEGEVKVNTSGTNAEETLEEAYRRLSKILRRGLSLGLLAPPIEAEVSESESPRTGSSAAWEIQD